MNKPSYVINLCKSCGLCIHFCPTKALQFGEERNNKGHYYPIVDYAACVGCGTCAVVCPEAAIDMLKGEE
ncbi:MAG: 4Fe-4S binding protein [Ruminococcaceae bacterium]|nr:4Fe-4S binding protein [Oscillospiraceae bacterium]